MPYQSNSNLGKNKGGMRRTKSTKVMIQKQYWNQLFSNFQECFLVLLVTGPQNFSFPRTAKNETVAKRKGDGGGFL